MAQMLISPYVSHTRDMPALFPKYWKLQRKEKWLTEESSWVGVRRGRMTEMTFFHVTVMEGVGSYAGKKKNKTKDWLGWTGWPETGKPRALPRWHSKNWQELSWDAWSITLDRVLASAYGVPGDDPAIQGRVALPCTVLANVPSPSW